MTRRQWWLAAASVGVLALASSWIGIFNGLAYDDVYIVGNNEAVHSFDNWQRLFTSSYWPKANGGDGYRPLTMLAFTAQWVATGGAGFIFHLVNIVLYVATSIAVFWLATVILTPATAWMAAALFAVHPVHVEAVANSVGQSELWVGLLVVTSMALYVDRRSTGRFGGRDACIIAAMYTVALFFKEHAVVLPGLILLAELTIVRDPRSRRDRVATVRPLVLGLVAVTAAFLLVRSLVLPEVGGFKPFFPFAILKIGHVDRVLTMIGLAPEWLRLLVWPATLSADYGPPQYPIAFGPGLEQIPGALVIVGLMGIAVATWRRAPAASFGLWWLFIALAPTSNFFFPTGILLSERTLFLPSVGAMIAVAVGIEALLQRASRMRAPALTLTTRVATSAALGAFLALGVIRSTTRTPVWESNETLFPQTVVDVPEVYRAHATLGAYYMARERRADAERELRTAVRLFGRDPYVVLALGENYRMGGACEPAVRAYEGALSMLATLDQVFSPLAACLADLERFPEARAWAIQAMRFPRTDRPTMEKIIALADSAAASRQVVAADSVSESR